MSKNFRTPAQTKKRKGNRFSPARVAALLLMAVLLVALGTVVFSQSDQQKNGKKYRATKEIVHDKESGKVRLPTEEETQSMVAQISTLTNRSSEGLTVNQAQNGMKIIDVEGRFNSVTVGRANADGTTEIRCVFSMEEAAEFLGLEEMDQ
jgi:hypothetical protein